MFQLFHFFTFVYSCTVANSDLLSSAGLRQQRREELVQRDELEDGRQVAPVLAESGLAGGWAVHPMGQVLLNGKRESLFNLSSYLTDSFPF